MDTPALPNDATGNSEMWQYVELLRALTATDHEDQGEITPNAKIRQFRFYMVGKLVRQDLHGPDGGFRETMLCPCHLKSIAENKFVKVFGPMRLRPRYSAHCQIDGEKIAEADTMEELWSAVESKLNELKNGHAKLLANSQYGKTVIAPEQVE